MAAKKRRGKDLREQNLRVTLAPNLISYENEGDTYLEIFRAALAYGACLGGLGRGCLGLRSWLCFLGWWGFLLSGTAIGLAPEKLSMNQLKKRENAKKRKLTSSSD